MLRRNTTRDRRDLEAWLSLSDPPPLFGEESVLRRVSREPVVTLGGPRALLMQIAHPSVAAGVSRHSGFRVAPLSRLAATLDAMLVIVFGRPEEAQAVVRRVREKHARVRGQVGTKAYSANDADLQLWVLATLIDTAEVLYERWVRPLSKEEREGLYEDWQIVGRLFGMPAAAFPEGANGLRAYVAEMLAGPRLDVGEKARALAEQILRPPTPLYPGPLANVVRALTAGLLDGRLRRDFGLPFGALQQAEFAAVDGALGTTWRHLPFVHRSMPLAWLSVRRAMGAGPATGTMKLEA